MSPFSPRSQWTAAQIAAGAFGLWWIGNAVAVFLAIGPSGGMRAPGEVDLPGISIAVNGWHGLFHLLTGAAGVAACRSRRASSAYALAMAVVYLAAASWAALSGSAVFGLIRVDELGSLDHAAEGLILLVVWLGSLAEGVRLPIRRPEC